MKGKEKIARDLDSVDLNGGIGSILKREREARRLSIREISKETAISPKYVEALENDDFSQFPGETYVIGFLKNYADFLNIDRNSLITLFRQQKIDTSQSPIEELVKSNFFSIFQNSIFSTRSMYRILFIALFTGLGVGLFNYFEIQNISLYWNHWKDTEAYCGGEREVRVSYLPLPGYPPRSETLSVNPPDAMRFSSDGLVLKFCLKGVKVKGVSTPLGIFQMRIDEKSNHRFQVYEGQSYVIDNSIKELEGLKQKLKFTPTVLSDFSARIEVETEKIENVNSVLKVTKVTDETHTESYENSIQVTLEFIKESYMEWVRDGLLYRGRLIPSGEIRTLEAENRLEIKLGNGGGVRITRSGVKPRLAGPISRIVKLEYRRIPDALDAGISTIKEFVEVIQ